MADMQPPRHCTRCGNAIGPSDNFCGVCGASVAPDVAHSASVLGTSPRLGMIVGLAAVLVLMVGIGSVTAMTLLRSAADTTGPTADRRKVAAVDTEKAQPSKGGDQAATPESVAKEEDGSAQSNQTPPMKPENEPSSKEASGPAPGYNLIQTPNGSLSVEVPSGWGVETGADSENEAGVNTWSYYAGEYLNSSMTTAPSLDTWFTTGSSGAYMVASKKLAQEYTDYELTHSLLHASKKQSCTAGPYEDFNRPPYTGKMQAWFDCGSDGRTVFTVAVTPKGRECVGLLDAIVLNEAGREAIEHIFDTFKVDCGRVS